MLQPQLRTLDSHPGEISLRGEGRQVARQRELRTLQDWVVDRNLRGVPGVADINAFGGLVSVVNPDPAAKMRYYGIALPLNFYTALRRG